MFQVVGNDSSIKTLKKAGVQVKNDVIVKNKDDSIIAKSILIADWKVADKFEANENFQKTDFGIKVKTSGFYFIYSNVVFTGKGTNCDYYLEFGSKRRECRVNTIQSTPSSLTREDAVSQRQPCYLGFSAYLNSPAEIKMVVNQRPVCDFETRTQFSVMVQNSYLGVIKL